MQKKAWHQQTKIKKVEYSGHKFDSEQEKEFYIYLVNGHYKPNIVSIELQPEFVLIPAHKKNDRNVLPMRYRADFKIHYINEQGETETEIIDLKGFPTPEFKMKKKLFEYLFSYDLTVIAKFPKKFGGGFGLLAELDKLKAQEKRSKDGSKTKEIGQAKKNGAKSRKR